MASTAYRSATPRRTVRIRVPAQRAWRAVSRLDGMPAWAAGVSGTDMLSARRSGVGAVRLVKFGDGTTVEEHVTSWTPGRSFTYVAAGGLPLRAYAATMSVRPLPGGASEVAWGSYMSQRTTEARFAGAVSQMGRFYSESLAGLRAMLEARAHPARQGTNTARAAAGP